MVPYLQQSSKEKYNNTIYLIKIGIGTYLTLHISITVTYFTLLDSRPTAGNPRKF